MNVTKMLDLVEQVQLHRIADLQQDGVVAVQGHAVAGQALRSPVSGIRAIAYHIVADLVFADGTIEHVVDSHAADFVVEDGSGRLEVSAARSTLALARQYSISNERGGSASAAVLRALQPHTRNPDRIPDRFTWSEHFLEAGERVYVCGVLRSMVDTRRSALNYRQNALRPTLEAGTRGQLVIADLWRGDLIASLESQLAALEPPG